MPLTQKQQDKFTSQLKNYRKKFLVKKYEDLDESATRLMINHFVSDILGYTQIDEVKTEYAIKGTYADYVIQVKRKKHFVVEVKAMQIDISEHHLRQSTSYAANEGIDWILLTNGKQFELFKVLFNKPISTKKVFSFDLSDISKLKEASEYLSLLTKKAVLKKELDKFWMRFQALEPVNLAKLFYSPEIVRILKRKLKAKTGILFSDEDVIDSIYDVIILKLPSTKPRMRNSKPKKVKIAKKKIDNTQPK